MLLLAAAAFLIGIYVLGWKFAIGALVALALAQWTHKAEYGDFYWPKNP